ncbi:hypothetical protein B0H13DRAFT_1850112 [Mycena leptocephala]|nr:hypothetical protein B0H13DRAFT_1850112 [Mycena leptocephala]
MSRVTEGIFEDAKPVTKSAKKSPPKPIFCERGAYRHVSVFQPLGSHEMPILTSPVLLGSSECPEARSLWRACVEEERVRAGGINKSKQRPRIIRDPYGETMHQSAAVKSNTKELDEVYTPIYHNPTTNNSNAIYYHNYPLLDLGKLAQGRAEYNQPRDKWKYKDPPKTPGFPHADDLAMADEIHEPDDDVAPTRQDLHDAKVTNTVAGLAKKVYDSRPIHTEFSEIIANPETGLSRESNTTELARRNATRWGSEYNCLQLTSHRPLITKAVYLVVNPSTKPCERNFHESVNASLCKNVQHIVLDPFCDLPPFKASDKSIVYFSSQALIDSACDEILEALALSPLTEPIVISFSVKCAGDTPAIIQLCRPSKIHIFGVN